MRKYNDKNQDFINLRHERKEDIEGNKGKI